MKFGICLPGNFKLPDSPAEGGTDQLRAVVDGFRFARETGYDYVEYSVGNLMTLSEEDMETAVDYRRQGLLKVEACNGFIPGTLPLVGDQVNMSAIRDYLEKALHRMAALGVETVAFGSGAARRIPEGVSPEQARNQLDGFLTLAESIARPLGITIVIEPLNHKETNTLLTVAESSAVVRRLHLPNLKALADLYHTYVENEPPQVLIDNAGVLRHIHVSDPEHRTIPVEHPYLRACGEALRQAGYTGRVSIECDCEDFQAEITGALPVLRKLF